MVVRLVPSASSQELPVELTPILTPFPTPHQGPLKHALSIATYTTTDTLDNYMVFRFVFPFINGSYLAVLFHRAMGGRIGKNCFMNPGSFRDHDIVSVGDDVILDECHVQVGGGHSPAPVGISRLS
jgi:hypothetical protein